jgi:hypothetical protein
LSKPFSFFIWAIQCRTVVLVYAVHCLTGYQFSRQESHQALSSMQDLDSTISEHQPGFGVRHGIIMSISKGASLDTDLILPVTTLPEDL